MNIVHKIGTSNYEKYKTILRDTIPITEKQRQFIKTLIVPLYQIYLQKFIFIHINKCGGTSIERALGVPFLTHDTMEVYVLRLGRRRASERFKFAFVREPLDRLLSIFFYECKGRGVFDMASTEQREFFQHWSLKRLALDRKPHRILMPQTDWLVLNGEIAVDFVGRFEQLEADFERVREVIPYAKPLPRLKVNKARAVGDIRWWYGRELLDRVAAIYWDDFENFGYRNPRR